MKIACLFCATLLFTGAALAQPQLHPTELGFRLGRPKTLHRGLSLHSKPIDTSMLREELIPEVAQVVGEQPNIDEVHWRTIELGEYLGFIAKESDIPIIINGDVDLDTKIKFFPLKA